MVYCGFQSKGDPDCFILWALQRPKENVFAPISVWCISSGLQFSDSPLQEGCVGDPKSAPPWAGAAWSLRDSSGCINQPKHPSATRGPENHYVCEDSEEHQALLRNCFFCISYLLVKRRKSSANLGAQEAREQHSHSRMDGSCAHLPLYWLCPHWSSSQRGTFFLCKDSSSLVSAVTACLGQIFLCFLILAPAFVSLDKAEGKAPCAPLQCLQDKDAASYTSPGQDPSGDCHTYILAEDLFPKWKF